MEEACVAAADAMTGTLAADPAPAQEQDLRHASDQVQARLAFDEFLERCRDISSEFAITDELPWTRELRRSLAEERLMSITASRLFELHVACLLADGWRPGQHALLAAAAEVFGWAAERRRLRSLGPAGALLDQAIDQRTMFDMQPGALQARQRRLIERLRDPARPSVRELARECDQLESLVARFPAWVMLVTSGTHIHQWRQMSEGLPGWRRKLAIFDWRSPSGPSDEKRLGGLRWSWTFFVALSIVARMAAQHGNWDGAGTSWPPASQKAQRAAAELVESADRHLRSDDVDGAIQIYTRAIDADSGNSNAYSGRAMAHIAHGHEDMAARDADMAIKLDRSNPVGYRARGVLALGVMAYADALADLTRSLQLYGDDAYTYTQRARTYQQDGQGDMALADAAQAIRLAPHDGWLPYAIRARIFLSRHQDEQAIAEADAMLAAMPKVPAAYAAASEIYGGVRGKDALQVVERGIAAFPDNSLLYQARAARRAQSDIAGRRQDLDKAIALDPRNAGAMAREGDLEFDAGNFAAASRNYTAALALAGAGSTAFVNDLLISRGVAQAKLDRGMTADADFREAQARIKTAAGLNNMCWNIAIHNVALQAALAACDAALERAAGDSYALDSKGFVLLQMARYREAIGTYDDALRIRPNVAASLYGRGVAKRRAGDTQGGDADLRAARKIDASIAGKFAKYGVVLREPAPQRPATSS